jgi:hypothetical protein
MTPRKTKIPVRDFPKIAEWILNRCTGEQLTFLHRLSNSSDLRLLAKIVDDLKEFNVHSVFSYNAKDDNDLALFRAAARGQVAGLTAFLYAVQAAKLEVERRKREKEIAKKKS